MYDASLPADTEDIRVWLNSTASDSSIYRLVVRNFGQNSYVDGAIRYDQFLGPRDFGLDDTHMPSGHWTRPPVTFSLLRPGDDLSFEVEGYDRPEKFDRPHQKLIDVQVAQAGEEAPRAQVRRVRLVVGWQLQPKRVPALRVSRNIWMREFRPVLKLLGLGLLVLAYLAYRK